MDASTASSSRVASAAIRRSSSIPLSSHVRWLRKERRPGCLVFGGTRRGGASGELRHTGAAVALDEGRSIAWAGKELDLHLRPQLHHPVARYVEEPAGRRRIAVH